MNRYLMFILIVSPLAPLKPQYSRLPRKPTHSPPIQASKPRPPRRRPPHRARRDGAGGDRGAILEHVSGPDVGGCGVRLCGFWGGVCGVGFFSGLRPPGRGLIARWKARGVLRVGGGRSGGLGGGGFGWDDYVVRSMSVLRMVKRSNKIAQVRLYSSFFLSPLCFF